jgi:multicomponent Na+:H+ antiporter subunit E
MMRLFYAVRYALIFIWELTKANIEVTKLVLSPTLKIRPGFLSVPMIASTDFEVTSLANSITLTPGTISVHVPNDRHAIIVHALDIGDDPDAIRERIQTALEANILKWTRPGNSQEAA